MIHLSGLQLQVMHTPGHTSDQIALLIVASTDPKEVGNIFTADAVLGHGTAVFENLAQYLQSLDKMKDAKPAKAYPGHGALIDDAVGKLEEYIAHRAVREREVLEVLKSGAMTSTEIVKIIYKDVPEDLHEAAERGIKLILLKLQGEGKVEEMAGRWRLTGKSSL